MKFQIKDRVVVYNCAYTFKGTVTAIEDGLLRVCADGESVTNLYHPRQCRKLVKKQRRRIWIHPESLASLSLAKPFPGWVEFVEVKKCTG